MSENDEKMNLLADNIFIAAEASILSLACSANTQTIAVGTELENHVASIHLW